MDPDDALQPNMPVFQLMNGTLYDNNTDINGPINVFINEDSSFWPGVPALPYQSTPETPLLFHDPSWSLTTQRSDALAFAPPRPLPFSSSSPHDAFGTVLGTATFTPALGSLDVQSLPPLSQHPSNEISTPSGEDVPPLRARRQPRIENGYKCQYPDCDTLCHTQGELTKHCLRKHTPESSWRFVCEVCGKRNYDKRDHGRHMKGQCGRAMFPTEAHYSGDAISENTDSPHTTFPSAGGSHTRARSKRQRKLKAQSPASPAASGEPRTLDFYRADHDHDTAKEALAAATSDLLRFINLRAAQIKIEAIVPTSHELMTFTAVHGIKKVGASPLSRTPSTVDRSAPDHDVEMVQHPGLRKRTAEDQSDYPSKKSRRPSISTILPADLDHPRATLRSPPRSHRSDNTTAPQGLSSSPGKQNVAITLTIRPRPGYQRSVTHPGHINAARQSEQQVSIAERIREEPETPPPPATKRPELRKRLKQISLSWSRIHLDRHIRSSSGLAWARYAEKLKGVPGRAVDL